MTPAPVRRGGVGGGHCLLARCESDPAAFAAFYDAYSERVLRYLVRRLLDAEVALDLMSETFAKALQRRRQFRGSTAEAEQAWLFSIASSELSHYWRHGKAERKALRRIGVSVPALTDHEARAHRRARRCPDDRNGAAGGAAGTARRPAARRRGLRVVSELSYEEIAQVVGTSPQTIRARVSRGLRTLAKALRDRGVDPDTTS